MYNIGSRHTLLLLSFVLQLKWTKCDYKEIEIFVKHCIPRLEQWPQLLNRFLHVANNIDNMWSPKVLCRILFTEREHDKDNETQAQLDEGK